jgi:hypothetical protein
MVQDGDRHPDGAEQQRVQLYRRGLNKTLATPHRKHVRRLALQQALQKYRELIPPGDR